MLNKLKKQLLVARKNKDELRISVLSFLLSKIQNKQIDLRGKDEELTDLHIKEVIDQQIKLRNDSIEAYEKGSRMDLVEKEENEKKILKEILNENFS